MIHDNFVFDNMEVDSNPTPDRTPRMLPRGSTLPHAPSKSPPPDDSWVVVVRGMNGRNGIFSSPAAAEPWIRGVPGAEQFTFSTKHEAEEYLAALLISINAPVPEPCEDTEELLEDDGILLETPNDPVLSKKPDRRPGSLDRTKG
jgi:hypothetical protein